MRAIVTRPDAEAGRWVDDLRERGVDALALPLVEIAPAPDRQPIRDALQRIAAFRAVMFVSRNAVQGFLGDPAPTAIERAWPVATRAWAPGLGTAQALRDAGVPAALVDAPDADSPDFDSEALWATVHGQPRHGDRFLFVRGSDGQGNGGAGREWLIDQVVAAGGVVESVIAYVRRRPVWNPAQQELARAALRDGAVWVFSSSLAIGNLRDLLPVGAGMPERAITTHPRIAAAAQAAGIRVVCPARPTVDAVASALKSLR